MRAYLTIHLPHESEALAFFSDVQFADYFSTKNRLELWINGFRQFRRFDKNDSFVNTPQSPITARVEPRPFYQATLTLRRSLKPFPETISQTGRTKT